jgi:hypothetical protein
MPRSGGAYVDSLKKEITMHFDEDMDNEQQRAADDQMRMLEDDCARVIIDIET